MSQWNSTVEQQAKDTRLRDHLNHLVGIGPKGLTQLESRYWQRDLRGGELTLYGTLRKRVDGQFALEPLPRRRLSNEYVDRFLDDCLELLGVDDDLAGYYYPEFNQRARVHGGACGIESVRRLHHYPQQLLDAMADFRKNNIVTNIGQSGCESCGDPATQNLITELKTDGTPVLGYVGFSAQKNPKSPYLLYDSFDTEALSIQDLGYLIVSILEKHDVPYNWGGSGSKAINTYPTV
ncbi:hypothetical protein ACFQL3_02195 [Natronoarchaeum sp. GCM10025321]|uniref:hypothetical protein n=1 Tax=Natronoarchaeum sp. GCM10025321 TaxID=3252684 RepID=UPI00361FD143